MIFPSFKSSFSLLTVTLISVFLLTTSAAVEASLTTLCPDGQFNKKGECRTCRSCPRDQIIRRPCLPERDTECGPFTEFNDLYEVPRPGQDTPDLPIDGVQDGARKDYGLVDTLNLNEGGEDDVDYRRLQKKPHRNNHEHRNRDRAYSEDETEDEDFDAFSDLGNDDDPRNPHGVTSPDGRGSSRRHGETSVQNPEEKQWKVLACALIVVLCIVCIFLIIFVFVVCYLRSTRSHLKQVLYSADQGPQRSSSMGAGSRSTYPSLRYVPVLTQGAGRPSSGGRASGAPAGGQRSAVDSYLYPDDYDTDNNGQTVSTAKSSDYVYFKTPLSSYDVCDV